MSATALRSPSLPRRYLLLPFLGLTTICNWNVVAFQPTTFSARASISHVHSRSNSIVTSPRFAHSSSLNNDPPPNKVPSPLSPSEITKLFQLLRDTNVLYDPSRGTCCRNKCSGCTYLDGDGNFLYDEYIAPQFPSSNGGDNDVRGWIAPYVKVDFGEKVHTSQWSKVLFPSSDTELEKNRLEAVLEDSMFSPLALQALWVTLSPSVGYPRLTSTEIVRAIKGMDGASYEMGGAVDYDSFCRSMVEAAAVMASSNVDVVNGNGGAQVVDYDALSKEELLQLVEERGMKTTFPKMKRIIIEELRFFDANGRQGKRHPVKNTLS